MLSMNVPNARAAFDALRGINRGELRVMDGTGDTKTIWDASKPDEVEAARALFKSLKAKRYVIYRVKDDDAKTGEVMNEFDPAAGKLIARPAVVGG